MPEARREIRFSESISLFNVLRPVRKISRKYIDTNTTSCYSLPCLFTLSLEKPSSNADPIPRPHSLPPCSQP